MSSADKASLSDRPWCCVAKHLDETAVCKTKQRKKARMKMNENDARTCQSCLFLSCHSWWLTVLSFWAFNPAWRCANLNLYSGVNCYKYTARLSKSIWNVVAFCSCMFYFYIFWLTLSHLHLQLLCRRQIRGCWKGACRTCNSNHLVQVVH